MNPHRLPLAAGLALLAATAALFAQSPADTTAPPVLRQGDALVVLITGLRGNLPEYREIVDRDGQIELPFLGLLPAAGKPIPQVESEMAAAYVAAHLSSNATATLTYVAHFDPAPDRSQLVRIDPRVPVPAHRLPPPAASGPTSPVAPPP